MLQIICGRKSLQIVLRNRKIHHLFHCYIFHLKAIFNVRPRPGCGDLVFSPATGLRIFRFPARGRGVDFSFSCPRPGPWVSAPNLLTKIPALFENIGTRGHQSAFLAHFTLKSLLWRQGNRNWSRGGSDIDPRLRQLCQKGAASPRQGNKGGASTAPAALSKGRVHGPGGLSKGGRSRSQQTYKKGHPTPLYRYSTSNPDS